MEAGFPCRCNSDFSVFKGKTMIFRYFNTILLCSLLFLGNFAVADVVQAYRTPNEADLQWLLGEVVDPIPSVVCPTTIIQTGYTSPGRTKIPMPPGDPCRPVGLPSPPIPPAPKSIAKKTNTGLAEEKEGVVNITATVTDSSTSVIQMSGDRIPPPTEVPREQELVAQLLAPTIERLPETDMVEHPLDFPGCGDDDIGCGNGPYCSGKSGKSNFPCFCLTCITCGDHRKNKRHIRDDCGIADDEQWITQLDKAHRNCRTVCTVPDMIGSAAWFTGHDVGITVTNTSSGNPIVSITPFTLPTMLLTRPNVAEHFNAGVQNRIWADCRSWRNATPVHTNSQMFTFGLEKQLSSDCSVELRMPVIGYFGSSSVATSAELGNVSLFLKQTFLQSTQLTVSGGIGASLPTADDWQPLANARLKNNVHYLVTFVGAQWHPSNNMFGHCVVQTDVPVKKHELALDGQPSVDVDGQHVIRTGIQLGRWFYRYDRGRHPRRVGAFAEVNYAVITRGSEAQRIISSNSSNDPIYSIYVNELGSEKSTLTTALGMPMVFGKLTCTSAVILPISGNDRPFSVGYNFSLSRQF